MKDVEIIALSVAISIVAGGVAGALMAGFPESGQDMMRNYYDIENEISVSPHDFIVDAQKGNTGAVVVDLRSRPEYETAHIASALNIPAGQLSRSEILNSFRALPENKTIIMHCYSSYCMLARKTGKLLAENGIYAKHMTAGWYEIKRDFPDFIANGAEPGVINVTEKIGCSEGAFGC